MGGGDDSEEATRVRATYPETVFKSVRRGECVEGMNYRWRVIHPDSVFLERNGYGNRDDRNNRSLVTKLEMPRTSFLFTGDIRKQGEEWIVQRYREEIDVDILVVPHHGGKNAADPDFLDAVSPKYALISAGYGNRFGHPRVDTLSRLLSAGSVVYRTDQTGGMVIDQLDDPAGPRLRTHRDFQLRPWESPADEFANLGLALGFNR